MKKCKWCSKKSARKQGRIWLCELHYRYQQMRVGAKRHGKTVPSYDELEKITPGDMVCDGCSRKMNWLAINGQSTVATLQHDRSGQYRIICRACNTRHAGMPRDEFYKLAIDEKWCPRCKKIKKHGQFSKDRSGRWNDLKTYCKECSSIYHGEWRTNRA